MKTMMVVSENMLERHHGEEYDSIVVVPRETVTSEEYQRCGKMIIAEIEKLWGEKGEASEIRVGIDAPTPIALILTDLREILKRNSGIILDLPWYKEPDVSGLDSESRSVLKKIGGVA